MFIYNFLRGKRHGHTASPLYIYFYFHSHTNKTHLLFNGAASNCLSLCGIENITSFYVLRFYRFNILKLKELKCCNYTQYCSVKNNLLFYLICPSCYPFGYSFRFNSNCNQAIKQRISVWKAFSLSLLFLIIIMMILFLYFLVVSFFYELKYFKLLQFSNCFKRFSLHLSVI